MIPSTTLAPVARRPRAVFAVDRFDAAARSRAGGSACWGKANRVSRPAAPGH